MRFLTRVAILFYVTTILLVSCTLLVFVANVPSFDSAVNYLYRVYHDFNLRIVFAGVAFALLMLNFAFYLIFSVRNNSNKVITFNNPAGKVQVSLDALENLIKRTLLETTTDIMEVKPALYANKKGLSARIKLILRSDANIPAMTSGVQDLVKRKIQSSIGTEKNVDVQIFVGKIMPAYINIQRPVEVLDQNHPANIPYHGYRSDTKER